MKISVITVCYNCENEIYNTLESVAQQTNKEFEYIVIDGHSTDKTLEVVKAFHNRINNMIVVSEEDQGIYDAMNKGVRAASGEYVFFLNAGDVFFDELVLHKIKDSLACGADIVYGNILKNDKVEKYKKNIKLFDLIYLERMICHQAIFAKRELLLLLPFNTEYKICADRDWLIRSIYLHKKIFYVKDLIVCIYDTNGVSSVSPLFYKESLMIAQKYGSWFTWHFVLLKRKIGKFCDSIFGRNCSDQVRI